MDIPVDQLVTVHDAIVAVCPIVSLDTQGNITFDPVNPPTATQQQAAEQIVANWPTLAPVSCYLWQLQVVMTDDQWTAVTNAVTAMNNRAVSAFFAHPGNLLPSNSTTLLSIAQAIGLTADQAVSLVRAATEVAIP
jgi:hypothetical protein